jgi:hypothetical protein
MFQVSILEFKDRPESPLYHLEHFIDGKYMKYNSNSGFVDCDEHLRLTPQAFSHFTFECSNHEQIVVDIQGVGDLYTDPQIHTSSGTEYGDGNLGIKGFALFFSSHICNQVCKSLGLTQFDLSATELKFHEKLIVSLQKSSLTMSRGVEECVAGSPSSFGEYFRHRYRCRSSTSYCSDDNNSTTNDLPDISESEGYESSFTPSPLLSPNLVTNHNPINNHHHHNHIHHHVSASHHSHGTMASSLGGYASSVGSNSMPMAVSAAAAAAAAVARGSNPMQIAIAARKPRSRNESSCLDSAFSIDEAANYFNQVDATKMFKPKPSGGSRFAADVNNNGGSGMFNFNRNPIVDSDDEDDGDDDAIHKSVDYHKQASEEGDGAPDSKLGLVRELKYYI